MSSQKFEALTLLFGPGFKTCFSNTPAGACLPPAFKSADQSKEPCSESKAVKFVAPCLSKNLKCNLSDLDSTTSPVHGLAYGSLLAASSSPSGCAKLNDLVAYLKNLKGVEFSLEDIQNVVGWVKTDLLPCASNACIMAHDPKSKVSLDNLKPESIKQTQDAITKFERSFAPSQESLAKYKMVAVLAALVIFVVGILIGKHLKKQV